MNITIFTDGACRGNGTVNAIAGCGVYFPNKEFENISVPFVISPVTNQRAELYAIYLALYKILNSDHDFNKITIYSDSNYSIKCLTVWINTWKKNNWRTASRKPVKNQDLIIKIDSMLYGIRNKVKFHHVRSHTGKKDLISVGNDIADKLANNGINC